MFELALALGGMTVGELKRRITCRELVQWRHLYSTDPWGDQRADTRFAWLAFQILRAFGSDVELRDCSIASLFTPATKRRKIGQSPERMAGILMAYTQRLGGKVQ